MDSKETDEMVEPLYVVSRSALVFRDAEDDADSGRARLLYHLETGDYFNTVATIVGFLEESLQKHCTEDPALEEREVRLARELRQDLCYLNAHYDIKPKGNDTSSA